MRVDFAQHRGAAPIQVSILAGDRITGDLQPVSPGRTVPNLIMDEQKSFLVGDLAEVLTGPFQRRLCVVLGQDEKSPLFFVAVYYPSEKFFIHTYLAAEQMRVIGHMADTSE
jgi:hypothetical protein